MTCIANFAFSPKLELFIRVRGKWSAMLFDFLRQYSLVNSYCQENRVSRPIFLERFFPGKRSPEPDDPWSVWMGLTTRGRLKTNDKWIQLKVLFVPKPSSFFLQNSWSDLRTEQDAFCRLHYSEIVLLPLQLPMHLSQQRVVFKNQDIKGPEEKSAFPLVRCMRC